jgi:acyl-CoA reductase-like NAD-dependent aldehyde dehydrogenase
MPAGLPGIAEPAIVIHSLGQAIAALKAAAGQRLVLLSAPGAGGYAGAGWFRALVDAARAAVPQASFTAYLDCDDEAGTALAALRAGIDGVLFTGSAEIAQRLADIAAQQGAHLATARPTGALDLGVYFVAAEADLIARCTEFLRSTDAAGEPIR